MEIRIALAAKELISVSADLSLLQQEYKNMFTAKCEEHGVTNPFQLSDDDMAQFFQEISSEWKKRKKELYKEGSITADQV